MSGRGNGCRATRQEASAELGLTAEAIRKRIQGGSILSDKGPDGRRYVYLDESHREVQGEGSELVEELRNRVASLERELERRADETERLHQIVAGLAPGQCGAGTYHQGDRTPALRSAGGA